MHCLLRAQPMMIHRVGYSLRQLCAGLLAEMIRS